MSKKTQHEGCEPYTTGPRALVTAAVAHALFGMGCWNVKARLPGWPTPDWINGSRLAHTPDLSCQMPDSQGTPLLVSVDVPRHDLEQVMSRWQLFESTRAAGFAVSFVVPRSAKELCRNRYTEGLLWCIDDC